MRPAPRQHPTWESRSCQAGGKAADPRAAPRRRATPSSWVRLFRVRSQHRRSHLGIDADRVTPVIQGEPPRRHVDLDGAGSPVRMVWRSEEHTSELQSRLHLVCRLLLEKKKTATTLTPLVNSGTRPPHETNKTTSSYGTNSASRPTTLATPMTATRSTTNHSASPTVRS